MRRDEATDHRLDSPDRGITRRTAIRNAGIGIATVGAVGGLYLYSQDRKYPGPDDDLPGVGELPERKQYPDPLTTREGKSIDTPQEWRKIRRPEILKMVQHYEYGYLPNPIQPNAEVVNERDVFNGNGIAADISLWLPGHRDQSVPMLVILPKQQPTDVILALSNAANDKMLKGGWKRAFCPQRVVRNGYGFASIHYTRIAPDDQLLEHGFDAAAPKPGPEQSKRGKLATWAWGLHRGVDYLKSLDSVDKVAVTGGSRLGKASLLAGATYEDIDAVIPHMSGAAGVTPYRGNPEERLDRIYSKFPYWFADRFSKFKFNEAKLPFDQHCLVACVAPRPLLDIAADQFKWHNPKRARASLKMAAPVYGLLGREGEIDAYSEESIPTDVAPLAQFKGDTGHRMDCHYMMAYMEFCDAHLRG